MRQNLNENFGNLLQASKMNELLKKNCFLPFLVSQLHLDGHKISSETFDFDNLKIDTK